jgi:threonine dehydratase
LKRKLGRRQKERRRGLETSTPDLISLEAIEAAAERIAGVVVRTPLLPFPDLSQELGGEVRLKCESLQRTGAFKIRGAYNLISQLSPDTVRKGVITYSSGNHAQALALAASIVGGRAVVVMPTNAPKVKSDGARRLGAEVVFEGTTSPERKARAEAIAHEEGLLVVPPFEHPRIIEGQGTVGLEIFEDWPEVDVVLAPIGGGGLLSGTAAALRRLKPEITVIGVEPEGAPAMRAALDAGEPVTLESTDSVADGLIPVRVGELTYRHVEALVDDVVTVTEEAIHEATALLLNRRKLVVEFSGAATVAAIISGVVPVEGKKAAAVLSGGNLDTTRFPSLT